jgi:DNA-binding beta-propeller fold protein YncE
MLMFISAPCV